MSEKEIFEGDKLPIGCRFLPKGNAQLTRLASKYTHSAGHPVYIVKDANKVRTGVGVPLRILAKAKHDWLQKNSIPADEPFPATWEAKHILGEDADTSKKSGKKRTASQANFSNDPGAGGVKLVRKSSMAKPTTTLDLFGLYATPKTGTWPVSEVVAGKKRKVNQASLSLAGCPAKRNPKDSAARLAGIRKTSATKITIPYPKRRGSVGSNVPPARPARKASAVKPAAEPTGIKKKATAKKAAPVKAAAKPAGIKKKTAKRATPPKKHRSSNAFSKSAPPAIRTRGVAPRKVSTRTTSSSPKRSKIPTDWPRGDDATIKAILEASFEAQTPQSAINKKKADGYFASPPVKPTRQVSGLCAHSGGEKPGRNGRTPSSAVAASPKSAIKAPSRKTSVVKKSPAASRKPSSEIEDPWSKEPKDMPKAFSTWSEMILRGSRFW